MVCLNLYNNIYDILHYSIVCYIYTIQLYLVAFHFNWSSYGTFVEAG